MVSGRCKKSFIITFVKVGDVGSVFTLSVRLQRRVQEFSLGGGETEGRKAESGVGFLGGGSNRIPTS